jgi:hypothetical protein
MNALMFLALAAGGVAVYAVTTIHSARHGPTTVAIARMATVFSIGLCLAVVGYALSVAP